VNRDTDFDPLTQPLDGAHAIEASAGTGKTYAITLLWLRLVLEERVPVERILVATFTKAATAELGERLLQAIDDARCILRDPAVGDDHQPIRAILERARGRADEREL